MKILLINQHLYDVTGGSEVQCDLIARMLTQRGHQVVYLAVHGKQAAYQCSYPVEAGSPDWKTLRRLVADYAPDVVYWRYNKREFLPAVFLLKRLGLKVVFAISHLNDTVKWSHKFRFERGTWQEKLKTCRHWLRPALASRVNHVGFFFVDGAIAQLKGQSGRLPVKQEIIVPNSIENTAVKPFEWPRPFLAWIANLKPAKNPEMFIRLSREFEHEHVDFLMVGHIQQQHYRKLLFETELPPNFHYLGAKSMPEVNGILQKALCSVHTCEAEGMPNVMMQSWRQGTPTLSLLYDPDGMIQRHKIGRYASSSFEQLKQDVYEMITQKAVRDEMGERAKLWAEESFSPENNIRRIEKFLYKICQE